MIGRPTRRALRPGAVVALLAMLACLVALVAVRREMGRRSSGPVAVQAPPPSQGHDGMPLLFVGTCARCHAPSPVALAPSPRIMPPNACQRPAGGPASDTTSCTRCHAAPGPAARGA